VIRTKVEFSGRSDSVDDHEAGAVPAAIVDPYGIASPIVNHYGAAVAADQKIAALALRSETKARDVFDLDLLLRRYASDFARPLQSEHAEEAAAKGLAVSYDNFCSEVLPFVDPDLAELYGEGQWEAMRERVVSYLRELAIAHGRENS
jgi:hypothetical protein